MVPFFPHQVVWEVYKEAGMLFCLFIAIACTLQWKWLSHASFLLPFSYFSISGRLEKWADRNLTQFKKNKCRVLWLGRTPSMNQDTLGASGSESSFPEEDLGVPVDTTLNGSWQCALATKNSNGTLGCLRQSTARGGGSCSCKGFGTGEATCRALCSGLLFLVLGCPGVLCVCLENVPPQASAT